MNSARARQRADDLQGRLKQRLEDLEAERQLAPLPPVVAGGALIVPAGLLTSSQGAAAGDVAERARERSFTERAAVDAVMVIERALGRDPVEMPPGDRGYGIESRAADGSLLFAEVKGRARGAETFTVTKSEIGIGRNKPDRHILAPSRPPATAPSARPPPSG
jgi:Protein NO VEIN, C-terminal